MYVLNWGEWHDPGLISLSLSLPQSTNQLFLLKGGTHPKDPVLVRWSSYQKCLKHIRQTINNNARDHSESGHQSDCWKITMSYEDRCGVQYEMQLLWPTCSFYNRDSASNNTNWSRIIAVCCERMPIMTSYTARSKRGPSQTNERLYAPYLAMISG